MKKILVVIALLFVFGGSLAYAENVGLIDIFSGGDTGLAKNFAKLVAFPESIETFVRTESFVSVEDECVDLSKNSDTAAKGLIGTTCTRIATAMYKDEAAKQSVFVRLVKVTEGKDPFIGYMRAFSSPDKVGEYEVVRIENHELGWFPNDVFDFFVIQEGQFTTDSSGAITMSYSKKATGQNAVTQYFINKHPPSREADPTR